MRQFFVCLLIALFTVPAYAHSMRVFAKLDAGQITGYAFFIGGGRPADVSWITKMDGKVVAEGKTDASGRYKFVVPDKLTDDINITVDTGEGHIATTTISQDRIGRSIDKPVKKITNKENISEKTNYININLDNNRLRQEIESAVEHQIGPLLERIEEMDSRMRLTDILSGIFLIIGLAGIGLWARSSKK